jgi:hypothetical protein
MKTLLESIASQILMTLEDIRREIEDRLDGWLHCQSSPLMSLVGPPRCELALQPIPVPVERPRQPSTWR